MAERETFRALHNTSTAPKASSVAPGGSSAPERLRRHLRQNMLSCTGRSMQALDRDHASA